MTRPPTATYDPEAELSGSLTVMGFGADDEIATHPHGARPRPRSATSRSKLIEGDLDIQQFLSSVATGEPPEIVYADRNQIGTLRLPRRGHPADRLHRGRGHRHSTPSVEAALDQVTFDGEVYGIPEFNVVQIIQANADLLAAGRADASRTSTAPTGRPSRGANETLMQDRRRQAHASSASTASSPSSCRCGPRPTAPTSSPRTAAPRSSTTRRSWRRSSSRSASTRRRAASARSRRSATPPTSSARATSSPSARSARCRWSSGTSTCSTTSPPTPRWRSTPSATTDGRAAGLRLRLGLGDPEGQREPRGRLPLRRDDDRRPTAGSRPPRRGSRCARRRAASSPGC